MSGVRSPDAIDKVAAVFDSYWNSGTSLPYRPEEFLEQTDSLRGQRYQHHVNQGLSIMLLARLNTDDRAFWFLGPATYLKL